MARYTVAFETSGNRRAGRTWCASPRLTWRARCAPAPDAAAVQACPLCYNLTFDISLKLEKALRHGFDAGASIGAPIRHEPKPAPPVGRYYEVEGGGYCCTNRVGGGPAVVFLAGGGAVGLDYLNVQQRAAELTTSVSMTGLELAGATRWICHAHPWR